MGKMEAKQSHRMKESKINWNEYFAAEDKTIYIQMAAGTASVRVCGCVCVGMCVGGNKKLYIQLLEGGRL